jgi:Flp pilus assembly protein TadB
VLARGDKRRVNVLEQSGATMRRRAHIVLQWLALVIAVVGVDVLVFRHRFSER